MDSLPFTGRQSALSVLERGVTRDDEEVLYPVVGPTGIGKSTLLEQFEGICRDSEIPVVTYSIREPASVDQFLSRLLERWHETHPDVSSGAASGVVSDLASNTGRVLASVPGAGWAGRGAGVLLQTIGEASADRDESADQGATLRELAERTREHYDSERVVLIVDQFDASRLESDVYEGIARFLRDVTSDGSASGLLCCVGTQERFYDPTADTVREIELGPFDTDTVETCLQQTGFDTDSAEEVRTAASGNPYFVERILQIAADRGTISAALNDLSPIEEERYEVLERRFLETLSTEKRRLLRETCALPELRPEHVASVTDADPIAVETELRELHHEAVISRIGYDNGQPVYRLHELQLDYLRQRTSQRQRARQHRRSAAYYAERAAESKPESSSELFTEEGARRLREFMTAGMLFEYHLQKLPGRTPVDTRVEAVLSEVENVTPDRAKNALHAYFRQHQPTSLDLEDLGISRQHTTDEITDALDATAHPTGSSVEVARLYQRVRDDERLTDDESQLIVLFLDTLRRTVDSIDVESASERDDVRLVRRRIADVEAGDYDDATALRPVVLVGLRLWYSLLTSDVESAHDIGVWEFIEAEYGLTDDDWRTLRDVALATMDVLLDGNRLDRRLAQRDGSDDADDDTGAEMAESEPIEQYGLQGGLFRHVSSPVLDGIQSIGNPSPEELRALTAAWTRLENDFAEDGHETVAALCRDIRQTILEPLSGAEAGPAVGFRIVAAFDRDALEVTDVEPAESVLRAGAAIRGLTNPE